LIAENKTGGELAKIKLRKGGRVFKLESGSLRDSVLTDVEIANGIDWSPDNKTMYLVDAQAKRVYAFDFNLQTGAISKFIHIFRAISLLSPFCFSFFQRGTVAKWLEHSPLIG